MMPLPSLSILPNLADVHKLSLGSINPSPEAQLGTSNRRTGPILEAPPEIYDASLSILK